MQMLSKVACLAALAPAVLAGSAPVGYPDPSSVAAPVSSAPVYSAPAPGSSVAPVSSDPAPVYPSNSGAWPSASSSSPVDPVSSSAYPIYPSGSSVAPVSSSTVPSATPTPTCWSDCFQENGVTSEDDLCGNTAVNACISENCCAEDDKAYWAWYTGFCPAASSSAPVSPISSSAVPVYPSGSSVAPVSSSIVPSATPTPTCWTSCFAEAQISSEDELCGNTQVNQCIYTTCSSDDDKAYWAWYESFCPAASSSVPVSPATSSAPSYPAGPSPDPSYYGATSWEVTSTTVIDSTSTVYITNVS